MRAARFDAATRRLEVQDVPVPVPGPGEVLVEVELGPGLFFGLQSQSLLGHLGYDKRHLDELVDLVATGRLDVSGSISDVMPLEDVGRGVERLVSKEGDPVRLVVRPWA